MSEIYYNVYRKITQKWSDLIAVIIHCSVYRFQTDEIGVMYKVHPALEPET